jgi:hypothetical protein
MIYALDPGPEQTAWLLYDDETHKPIEFAKCDNADILNNFVSLAMENYRPRIVIEMVASYGKPVGKEVFETCVWIGRFAQAAKYILGCEPARLYRTEIKLHLCHATAKVNDGIIRQALIDRFGPGKETAIGKKKTPGPLHGIVADVWAALAVAVTYADKNPI